MDLAQALQNMTAIQMVLYVAGVVILSQIPLITKMLKDRYDKQKPKNSHNPHIGCANYSSLQTEIRRYVEIHDKIRSIKDGVLPAQMATANKANIKIKSLLLDNYKQFKTPPRDIAHYGHILFQTMHEAQNTLKEWLEYNHIAEKSDIEYREYVKEIKDLVIKQHINLLDREYNSEFFSVTRNKLHKSNMDNLKIQFDEILDDMMVKVRDISIKAHGEIAELEMQEENIFNEE